MSTHYYYPMPAGQTVPSATPVVPATEPSNGMLNASLEKLSADVTFLRFTSLLLGGTALWFAVRSWQSQRALIAQQSSFAATLHKGKAARAAALATLEESKRATEAAHRTLLE